MNNNFLLLRALRGPLMLITLGALASLHRFQDVSLTKTWPVLLIVLGVMKLLERSAAQADDRPLSGPLG